VTERPGPTESDWTFRRVGVIGRFSDTYLPGVLHRLKALADAQRLELFFEGPILPLAPDDSQELEWGEGGSIDLLLALGGDGTILRGGRLTAGQNIPILGINLGHLGFLTASPEQEMEDCLMQLMDGRFLLEWRSTLEARLFDSDGVAGETLVAWNDFMIHEPQVGRVSRLDLLIRDAESWTEIGSFSGDGVVLSTPTGSTAYSLSAGGPIVMPSVECFLITPVCPHTLAIRPLVVPADRSISVRSFEPNRSLVLTADGQIKRTVGEGGEVWITSSEIRIPLMRFTGQTFFSTIRRKLSWAARPGDRN